MWLFIMARLRQWIFFAIAVPVLTLLVRLIRTALEKRSGETKLTRGLQTLEDLGQRKKRRSRSR
ncbi:MAG: hypothetical protein QOF52_1038 [Propionibacteriaceae bacterium]|jgi:hypothetical protein|nr:hypothetical protein [Propionibacteriaceae bacterium]MDX6321180.1 hypothetical protein [Propionibacteriaceae bacterium]